MNQKDTVSNVSEFTHRKGGITMGGIGGTGTGIGFNMNIAFVLFLILILLILSDD